LDLRKQTSWNSHLEHVNPLEMLEVQVINSVVPFLFVQELSALMRARNAAQRIAEPTTAAAMRALWEQYAWLKPQVMAACARAAADKKKSPEAEEETAASAPASGSDPQTDSKTDAHITDSKSDSKFDCKSDLKRDHKSDSSSDCKSAELADSPTALSTGSPALSAASPLSSAPPSSSASSTSASSTDPQQVLERQWLDETCRALKRRRMCFIVNVSSPEGQFQTRGKKSSEHPHTNMAKAGLNMVWF
jgi:hypothetical protein